MVGNDIIDIHQTNLKGNWKRQRFVQKVFNLEEQETIRRSPNPFNTIWRMWSMKESAYKLYLQNDKERFFYPSKIHCQLLSPEKGKVCIEGLYVRTHTEINSKYIFTNAFLSDLDRVENDVFYLTKSEGSFHSEFTHQRILQHVAKKYRLDKNKLGIKKTRTNIPELFYEDQKLNVSFSLSHHGNYGAFSMLNN